jgi:guanosine-3',5'-bis(diphosphate) 3'-pyrophosphohydrolase
MPAPIPLYFAAASFAARAHQHQYRKDGITPYIAHPFRVAMIVRDLFAESDERILVAALLHDTIEDTTTDYDDLAELFGDQVARTVAALTKNATLPEAEREREYDDRLSKSTWHARLIKLADAYDNCNDRTAPGEGPKHAAIEKAKRALVLAAPDAEHHESTRRAIDLLTTLIADFESQRS